MKRYSIEYLGVNGHGIMVVDGTNEFEAMLKVRDIMNFAYKDLGIGYTVRLLKVLGEVEWNYL